MLPTDKSACIQIVNEKEVSVNDTKYVVNAKIVCKNV